MSNQESEVLTIQKQWFINSNQGKITDHYDLKKNKALGEGSYGTVFKAKKKGTKIVRAIKQIPKNKVKNPELFQREIELMKQLDHPNIIKLYESFEDAKNIYLVMEVCDGGELFDRIIEKGQFTESEARSIFCQIMQAICYCHAKGIAHRDLKPENFLLLTKHDESPLKVIDFGLSTTFDNKKNLQTKAGTPYYISPEVLEGKYDQSCDIWSSGVILYILLSGVPPFYGDTDPEILQAVKKGKFTFDIPEFEGVQEPVKDLIRQMITNPKERINAEQVLKHPWMKDKKKTKLKTSLNFASLKNFARNDKLKKVALTFIASQLSEHEICELGKLFRQLDDNGDGVLSIEEIKQGISSKGGMDGENAWKEIQGVLQQIDTDGSGRIDYTEFLAATMERSVYLKEEKLVQAFKALDTNSSGKISKENLMEVLGSQSKTKNSDQYWNNMIAEVDTNGDGEIDYKEFVEMMASINNK